jgi:5-hydroxyisourate hydrolase-like protein (transthyretin family)
MALRSRFSSLSLFLLMLPAICGAVDISGVVLDTNDTPLAGVKVAAGEAGSAFSQDRLVQTVTDAEGKFTAKDVPDPTEEESITVEAFVPGWTTDSDLFNPKDPKGTKLKLTKARKISIQLLGLDGKPAAGVKVAQAECAFPSLWGLIIKTDQAGKVAFPVAPESGVYVLCISDSRCVHSEIQIRVPEDDGAKFLAVPGGSIEGKLVDHTGKPISGASVSAMADLLGFWGGYGTATSDSSGKFRIDRLDAGDVFLSVKPKPTYAIVPIKCKVVRGKVTQLSTVKAEVPGIIAGRVLDDETGKPVAGIEIQYTPEVWSSGWCGDFTRSDKDGNFKIYGVGAISAVPSLWSNPEYKEGASNVKFERLVMKSGQVTPYHVRLKKTPPPQEYGYGSRTPSSPAKALTVLVLDEADHPVSGCKLRLMEYDSREKTLGDPLATAETNQQGKASVDVPKGDAFVWLASKPGYAGAWNGTSHFVADPVVLRLHKEAPLRGQLVNQAGKAVPDARITAKAVRAYCYTGETMSSYQPDLQKLIGSTPSAVTDSRGVFTLAGIPTRSVAILQISHPEYMEIGQSVTVSAGQVKLTAAKPGILHGKIAVNYPSLMSLPLMVKVEWHGDYEGQSVVPLKPDGSFDISGVPPTTIYAYGRATLCLDPNCEPPEGVTVVKQQYLYPFHSVIEVLKPNGRVLCYGLQAKGIDISGKRPLVLPVASLIKITGLAYGKDGKTAPGMQISYQGKASTGDMPGWRYANLEQNGRWTIYAGPGDIQIALTVNRVFTSTKGFKSSFEASKSDIVFDLSKLSPEELKSPDAFVSAHIRVVDPKGIAVPRPLMKVQGTDVGLYNSGSGLDGTVDINGPKDSLAKITSTFLKKPAVLKLDKDDQWKTIAFDYAQPWVPTAEETKNAGIGFG